MNKKNETQTTSFTLHPVGTVNSVRGQFTLQIDKPFRPGLTCLEQFSHAQVFWWADRHDTPESRSRMTTELPYAPGITAGVFACRAEYRPNPVAVTICPVLAVDHEQGIVTLAYIDAFDKSPVLDIKPYIPVSDRVQTVRVAEWFKDWPQWYEDAAEFFSNIDLGK